MDARFQRRALAGMVGLAFVLRVPGLQFQSLWRDEVDALRFAGARLGDLAATFVQPGQNGPLYFLILRPWLDLVGRSEFALRFFSVFFGVLAVPLFYQLGRRLFPRLPGVGLLGSLLVATSPYLVWYSQEGKMYALVVFLALLSMERYLAALERGGWTRWTVYVLATSALLYVHLVGALIVPVQIAAFLLRGRQVRLAGWRGGLASLAALTLPYLPLLIWQVPMLMQPADTGFQFVPLHQMAASLLTSYSLGVVQAPAGWVVGPFVGLALASVLIWGEKRCNARSLLLLALWLVLPVIGLFLVSLSRPLYTARYLIFVAPAYLLLLAAGAVALGRRSRLAAALLLAAVLVSNGWSLWQQARTPLKADFRGATEYLVGRIAPGDLLLFHIPYGRYSFEYYYPRYRPARELAAGASHRAFLPVIQGGDGGFYDWAEGPYTNSGMPGVEVDWRMAELVAGRRAVWLVASEAVLWDGRGLVQDWLERYATRTEEAHFVRVSVYRYELP